MCAHVRACALYLLFCGVMVGAGGNSPIVFDLRPGFNNFLTEISFHVSPLLPPPTFVFSGFVHPHLFSPPFHPSPSLSRAQHFVVCEVAMEKRRSCFCGQTSLAVRTRRYIIHGRGGRPGGRGGLRERCQRVRRLKKCKKCTVYWLPVAGATAGGGMRMMIWSSSNVHLCLSCSASDRR